jgi:hypothetical protein
MVGHFRLGHALAGAPADRQQDLSSLPAVMEQHAAGLPITAPLGAVNDPEDYSGFVEHGRDTCWWSPCIPFQADTDEGGSTSVLVAVERPAPQRPEEEDVAVRVLVPTGPPNARATDHPLPGPRRKQLAMMDVPPPMDDDQQQQQQQGSGADDMQQQIQHNIVSMPGSWDLAASSSGRLHRQRAPQGSQLFLHLPPVTTSNSSTSNNHASRRNSSCEGSGAADGEVDKQEAGVGVQQVLKSGHYLLCSQLVLATGTAQVRGLAWLSWTVGLALVCTC